MLIRDIPYHLRNTVEQLDLPIFMELKGDDLIAPKGLALGDTLMVLGVLRNAGRPMRLHLETRYPELVSCHSNLAELVDPPEAMSAIQITSQPVGRRGRAASFSSSLCHRIKYPVLPVDQIRANPVLAHSIYYGLHRDDDRPGLFFDKSLPFGLKGLLSGQKPNLLVYPVNPGRKDPFWHDPKWWEQVLARLKKDYCLIAVGADDYGSLAGLLDAALPKSDPASRLPDLARLCKSCQGFLGRDGGLTHLANASGAHTVTVWDSMSSYRFWSSRASHNILMSNPYGFRYPQALRLGLDEMKRHFRNIQLRDSNGTMRSIELPLTGFKQSVRDIFGDFNSYAAQIQESREEEEDRLGVRAWMKQPQLKQAFYAQSQEFTLKAVTGKLPRGQNWVAPLAP
jgi:hypothetical protein